MELWSDGHGYCVLCLYYSLMVSRLGDWIGQQLAAFLELNFLISAHCDIAEEVGVDLRWANLLYSKVVAS